MSDDSTRSDNDQADITAPIPPLPPQSGLPAAASPPEEPYFPFGQPDSAPTQQIPQSAAQSTAQQPSVETHWSQPSGEPYGAPAYSAPSYTPPAGYSPDYTAAFASSAPPAHVAPAPAGSGKGRTAGLLVGALILGAAGGAAAAAGVNAINDEPVVASSNSDSTTAKSPVSTASDSPAAVGSVEEVAKRVLPSVVKIAVSSGTASGSGSGVILTSNGLILTNNHVVDVVANGGTMSVAFNDGTTATAKVVGTDAMTDLAVIKVDGVSGLTPAAIGNSDNLDVGEGVIAIGSPYGLEATVTSGIVSALNRPVSVGSDGQGNDTTYPAIQTDAAINPGNSGGALVNLNGEVIGINSSIRTASDSASEGGSIGLGFAIPISNVLPIVEQLEKGDTPTHARLGITVGAADQANNLAAGARIQDVTSGSAGDKAGLKSGDVVTKVDDKPVSGVEGLVATVRGYRPGETVTLTVVRDGKTMTLKATLDSDASDSTS